MRVAAAIAALLALFAPQQEDWTEELRKLDGDLLKIHGRLYLLRALRQEMLRATKALDESKLELVDRHLLTLAQVARPYNEDHANRVVALALTLRAEIRAEGAACVLAVADDLKQGRVKEAQAKIDEALAMVHLATTYRAEIERLRGWLKKAPDPAAVEAEVAKWRAMMPPGRLSTCAPCQGTGETDCTLCLSGSIAQSCRLCSGKGSGACGLCNGQGRLPHGGYGGELRFKIEKEFKYRHPGEKGNRIIHAQRLFWTLKPCGGKGRVDIESVSNPLDPNKPAGSRERHSVACADLFNQIKLNVFNGKARIFSGEREERDEMKIEQSKLLFADYERCKDGTIPCDACEGRKEGKCKPCGGKGMRLGPCTGCRGSGSMSCPTCKTSGDSAWLASKLPVESVPALGSCLDLHARALAAWQEKRAQERSRRETIRAQLAEARKDLDPTAKLTPESVNIACAKCSGKGGPCEGCWGGGRREYFPDTPVYEKYAAAKKLSGRLAEMLKASVGVSSADIQLVIADTSVDKDFKLPPGSDTPPPGPKSNSGGSAIGGKLGDLPADIKDLILKADGLHEEGKKAMEAAHAASGDNDKFRAEAKKAKECFYNAQQIYNQVQESLDEKSIDIPREFLDRSRTNLQALKLARNLAA